MKPASFLSFVAFLIIVGFVIAVFVAGTYFATRREAGDAAARTATLRFAGGLTIWLLAFSLFVSSGVIEMRLFPLVSLTFVVFNLVAVIYAFSDVGRRLAMNLSL